MYRLWIVEDDMGIAEAIQTQAELWDMQVRCVRNFRNVMAEFADFDPHIVLLDISLPFADHFHFLRLRQSEYGDGDESGCGRFYCQAL